MDNRATFRLNDILDAVTQISLLLDGKSLADLQSDRFLKAAYERFLEILSEAARHLPDAMKAIEPEIQWRRIADIGNHLRHAYHSVDADILWALYEDGKLVELREAVERMLSRLRSGTV
jgi:uncharacterized protein with HEPN domain